MNHACRALQSKDTYENFFCRLLLLVLFFGAFSTDSRAQGPASAKIFLHSVFAAYTGPGKSFEYAPYLHSSLKSLMDADAKAVGTDVPVSADQDLICNCQEWDGLWVHSMKVEIESSHSVQADVSISVYKPTDRPKSDLRTLRYTLEWEHGHWTFYDIEDISSPRKFGESASLREQIKKEIAAYRSRQTR